ncbi:uncharacterized protein LOC136074894 [Hydra vulgaris]|uniref:Uncharacterized protein LOC136074894 n=1 Tax=Hydra vulgaris TaxID=6087 RepID=A0ABM4B301_HYDVU
MSRDGIGLRMGHKLREEHIQLTPQSRMRVNLAAQVLSTTVMHMLEEQGDNGTIELRRFISLMDNFFDCFNVSKKANKTRKPMLNPYTSHLDERFAWLNDVFLKYFNDWQFASATIPWLKDDDKKRLCLSKQTLDGFRITVHSFTELGKCLLQENGVCYLLSEKFTQDPLEEYFSKQRRRGGSNDNPSLNEFNRNFLGLNITGDCLIKALNGNYCGRDHEDMQIDINDNSCLPKKKLKDHTENIDGGHP